MPAFNAAAWIGEAIGSVLGQTWRDWTLMVVDDGSTDGTGDVVAGLVDPRIRLFRQANAGVSAARNAGLASLTSSPPSWPGLAPPSTSLQQASKEDVGGRAKPGPDEGDGKDAVLFLDADDWLAPDALARLTDALDATPDAVAASGPYLIFGGTAVRQPQAGDLLPRLLVRNLFANGGHLLIRTETVRAVGGFRPHIAYGEDWEFWIRVALLGPFAAVRGPPVLFVRQPQQGAYQRMAADPASFAPCMEAIFTNPALIARFSPQRLASIRRRTEAENAWIIGRELIRHGQSRCGRRWLRRSVLACPSLKRMLLLLSSHMVAAAARDPFKPYRVRTAAPPHVRYPVRDC